MKSLMLFERFAGPVVRSHFRVFSEALSAIVSDDISISEDSVLDGEVLLLRATSGAELDLAVTRLRSDCDFDITVSKPRPVYKETFLAKANSQGSKSALFRSISKTCAKSRTKIATRVSRPSFFPEQSPESKVSFNPALSRECK